MKEIYHDIFIGNEQDYYAIQRENNWAILHCCKHPFHCQFVGYRGTLPPTHSNYALKRIENEMAQYAPQPKQYVSGETFYLLGRGVRLKMEENVRDSISSDGIYLHLCVKDTEDFAKKQKMVSRYLDEQCRTVFGETIMETYPVFQKYGVQMPTLRIRDMETRWGSCSAIKGGITLNKRLLEAPRNCIEYVVMHEFCHFIHPNHSKHFYSFLTMLMPDWKERKIVLDRSATFWL